MIGQAFLDPAVEAVFAAYARPVRDALHCLRGLIFETAGETKGVGDLVETLKWGQPAYRPARPRIGTTLRIDAVKGRPDHYALFVHCQTSLADTFRGLYGDTLEIEGDRAIVFSTEAEVPRAVLKHCISLALTYHTATRGRQNGAGPAPISLTPPTVREANMINDNHDAVTGDE